MWQSNFDIYIYKCRELKNNVDAISYDFIIFIAVAIFIVQPSQAVTSSKKSHSHRIANIAMYMYIMCVFNDWIWTHVQSHPSF